jgi:hypothetical protein
VKRAVLRKDDIQLEVLLSNISNWAVGDEVWDEVRRQWRDQSQSMRRIRKMLETSWKSHLNK